MTYGKVSRLYRYPQKGGEAVEEQRVFLRENKGMDKDWHSDGGQRQLSLLSEQSREWMESQRTEGFCFQKFRENIRVEGMELSKIQAGDVLKAGEAELEITESMKSCYPELCALAGENGTCQLPDGCRFAKVTKSGSLAVGDAVLKVTELSR